MKTGNTGDAGGPAAANVAASMEPGHEDREYLDLVQGHWFDELPQWSPVMKTGNTCRCWRGFRGVRRLNGARS